MHTTERCLYRRSIFLDQKEEKMKRKLSAMLMSAMILFPASALAFTDTGTHWAKQYIDFARDNNLVAGYTNGSYGPEDRVTRAQFATMITNYKNGARSDANFPDVAKLDWFYGFVGYVTGNKIMGGYPDGTFKPNNFITRAEVASTIKSMEYPNETETSNRFSDTLPDWAANAINITAKHGIFSGDTENKFRPNDYLTRAEAATILAKMKGFIPKEEPKPINITKFTGMPQADQNELDAILKELGADDSYIVTNSAANSYDNQIAYDVYLPNFDSTISIFHYLVEEDNDEISLGKFYIFTGEFTYRINNNNENVFSNLLLTLPEQKSLKTWANRDTQKILYSVGIQSSPVTDVFGSKAVDENRQNELNEYVANVSFSRDREWLSIIYGSDGSPHYAYYHSMESGLIFIPWEDTNPSDPYHWRSGVKEYLENEMYDRGYLDYSDELIFEKASINEYNEGLYGVSFIDSETGVKYHIVTANAKTGWYHG